MQIFADLLINSIKDREYLVIYNNICSQNYTPNQVIELICQN